MQHAFTQQFIKNNNNSVYTADEKRVLSKLCSLYAAFNIEKRLGDFYAGGFAPQKSRMDSLIRDGITLLCKDLANEAVSLVDVLAPPDFVIKSPLGMSDGDVRLPSILPFYLSSWFVNGFLRFSDLQALGSCDKK